MSQTDFQQLCDAVLALFPPFDGREQALSMKIYRLLAEGAPVPTEALGRGADVLSRWTDVRMDAQGRVIGYAGLTLVETQHRMKVAGRTLFAWCAWDTLFLPALLGVSAEVQSICPASGEGLEFLVGPREIVRAPEGVLVSLVAPDPRQAAADLIGQFCCHVHFLASEPAAREWTARRPGTPLATLPQAWELGQRRNALRYARRAA